MRTIPLTKDFVALVDDADFEALNAHKWHANIGSLGSVYARRTVTVSKGKRQHIFMHCHIMSVRRGDGMDVDHQDHDGLNNQRYNLRVCTHQKNSFNRKKFGGESQYKGVSRHGNKWRAAVSDRYLGVFDSERIAAEVYDDAAREMAGEYAVLNFPDRQPTQFTEGVIQ